MENMEKKLKPNDPNEVYIYICFTLNQNGNG